MFRILVISEQDRALITRLLDYLEGVQQSRIDALTARLRAANAVIKAELDSDKGE